eukprot:CAMPEP_0184502224 /NCGR_PEP_ID=MMETSP0113_2-20130426/49677_1 /TAXON_ID=91329 /ORGANISM="Norrisiella sphaerica, Strain BC52" /LENGTH=123 /DNA_ID=CAMNT_0026891287 /DNA_START=40 /DNA_END=407 /DNA_ORIENTATION=+
MNLGDVFGDAYFDLGTIMAPILCKNASYKAMFTAYCDNPETDGGNLVIHKVIVEAENRFSTYGRCNVCKNGTLAPYLPQKSCKKGVYYCVCREPDTEYKVCESRYIGHENVNETYGKYAPPPG